MKRGEIWAVAGVKILRENRSPLSSFKTIALTLLLRSRSVHSLRTGRCAIVLEKSAVLCAVSALMVILCRVFLSAEFDIVTLASLASPLTCAHALTATSPCTALETIRFPDGFSSLFSEP
jgi:hypothetical protein